MKATSRPISFIFLTILSIVGCREAPNVADSLSPADAAFGEIPGADPTALIPSQLDTVLTSTESLAGEAVRVQCIFYNRAGEVVTGPRTVLVASQPIASEEIEYGFELIPTEATSYQIQCTDLEGTIVDPTPATLDVHPNLPFSWNLELENEYCFQLNRHLPIQMTVYDTFGNEITDQHATITSIPEDGLDGDINSGLRFTEEGIYDITITLVGEMADNSTISPITRNVHVDETGPLIAIDAPMRGEMLELGNNETMDVTILGSVTDAVSVITSLSVDDVEQPIESGLSSIAINTLHSSRWGLSVVTGTAEDECGNVGYMAHGFLRSGSYYAPAVEPTPQAAAINGAIAQINQPFLDDEDRGDMDDLATLVQNVVSNVDLNEEIAPGQVLQEDPYAEDCETDNSDTSYKISRDPNPALNITMSGPRITQLQAVDGGLRFDLEISDVTFPILVNATASTCFIFDIDWVDITQSAVMGFSNLQATGTFGINHVQGETQVNLDTFNADFTGTYVDLDCGLLDFACDLITQAARELIEDTVESAVRNAVRDDVPAILEQTIDGLAVEQSIELPAPLSKTLNVVAQPALINLCGPGSRLVQPESCAPSQNDGSLLVGLTTHVFPSEIGESIPENARGAIERSAAHPEFIDSDHSFGVALRDDFLNQILWALWYTDGLNIDLVESFSDLVPEAVESGTLRATLPPVIMPGTGDNMFDIGLGDLHVKTRVNMTALLGGSDSESDTEADSTPDSYLDAELYASVIMGSDIDIDPATNTLQLTVQSEPEFYFHIVELNNGAYSQETGILLEQIIPAVLPDLLGQTLASFPLPQIDLSAIVDLPEDTTWEIHNAQLNHTDGYVQVSGNVVLVE